ncbi:unnamed protein product [Rhizophagus irregularis]|nr:unnamed protein product [Rhizophagus irregularis]
MKRCWDNDPEKRPTANELINIFYKWSKKYPIERNDEKRIPASVRTESYGLPDTKMTLAESEVRTSDFDLSSKKKFGKKIMLQKVKNKPMTIRLPKPMDTNTDYRRRIDSILELCKKATNHHGSGSSKRFKTGKDTVFLMQPGFLKRRRVPYISQTFKKIN